MIMVADTHAGINLVAPRRPHHRFPRVKAKCEREPEMEIPKFSTPTAARQELEESWRLRLDETLNRYHTATEAYRGLLQQQPEGMPPGPDGAGGLARQAESEALAEYTHVLRIFTDLTLHGNMS